MQRIFKRMLGILAALGIAVLIVCLILAAIFLFSVVLIVQHGGG
jgi:hypothetical protein